MTKIERVKKVCKWLVYNDYADNDKELADYTGYTKSSFSQIINEKVPLSAKFIDKLCSIDENINKVWVHTGKGEMLVKDNEAKKEGGGEKKGIPMLPFDAFAGMGDDTISCVDFDTIEERYVIPLFDGIKIDFMIPVRGSSMYPKYSSGDVVACRLVEELLFVQWNKVYVIDTISQGVIMKRLLKGKSTDHIICKSDNKDYDEFPVPIDDIRSIALVVGVIRLE